MQLYTVPLYRVQLKFPVAAVFNTEMDCCRSPKMETKWLGWRVDNDAAAMFEYGQCIIWQACIPVIVNANRNAWVSLKYSLK